MPEPKLIEIHNASIWRGTTHVFDKLTLSIDQHERVAILGPNGSGKTTLLKTINRELYPVVAEDAWIKILGREKWNVWDLRKHIGVVSHDLQNRYTETTTALEVDVLGFHHYLTLSNNKVGWHSISRRHFLIAAMKAGSRK